uniref:Uncharacterized protein n=1 Tax=Setaria viridis TaxID=4556 RepID=A0A4U6T1Y8_SETVI|nr:hypothetical protein SEVIR_9G257150v2 [Setaria viridis]
MRDGVWEQDQDSALARPCILGAELGLQLEMTRGQEEAGVDSCAPWVHARAEGRGVADAHLEKEKGVNVVSSRRHRMLVLVDGSIFQ